MIKNLKSSSEVYSESSSRKLEDEKPDKRNPDSDDTYESIGERVKETPITGSPDHPHQEEILDGTSK